MGLDIRVIVALSVIALILAPAAVLRAVCAGHSCDEPDEGAANVPFCSLPDDQRRAIVAGFREGRSPDILTVSGSEPDDRVPLIFWGAGIDESATIPDGAALDSVAPTIAEIVGLDRPHPEVRSGEAIPNVASGDAPKLVVVIVVKGLGVRELTRSPWERLRDLGETGTTTDGRVGSLPHDPAAVLTTIGTGGVPSQHGITGTLVRNDVGKMVAAWGRGAPVSVIATLADDLDELRKQRPLIGLVAASETDRGIIGGNWYVDVDKDVVEIQKDPKKAADAAREIVGEGFGTDAIPDLLAVTLSGPPTEVDRALGTITRGLSEESVAVIVTGTGSPSGDNEDVVEEIERSIPDKTNLIEAVVPAGFFVDQQALTRTGKTEDEVIDAIQETGAFADAFAAITVSFARYC